MIPDTWVPTVTVFTASMLPVAVTLFSMFAGATASVVKFTVSSFFPRESNQAITAMATTTPTMAQTPLIFFFFILFRCFYILCII